MPAETPAVPRAHITTTNLVQIALVLAILAAMAWRARPDGRLHLFFPALVGDTVIMRLPSGGTVLVDGGSAPAALSAALGRRMPFWQRTIQAVLLTSPGSNSLPGQVDALAHYHAEAAYASSGVLNAHSATLREWQRLLREAATPIRLLRSGQRVDLGDGVFIRVLAVEPGPLLQVVYGRTSVILAHSLPGGAPQQLPTRPADRSPDLAVLPWQSDPHTSPLAALQPAAVLYSDGLQADQPPLLSYAERRIGRERQYHERIDGAVEWISNGRDSLVVTEYNQR